MFRLKDSICKQDLVPHQDDIAIWQREVVSSDVDMKRVIQTILDAMVAAGFSDKDVFRLHLALEEAIVNANKHAHAGDWTKPIVVRYHVGEKGVVAEIEDRGPGFAPDDVPDPLAPENLERASGRGLLLMRTYMSHVCHNAKGNCICMCKECGLSR
jgi:serine/threonine-protein kinase RsbW